ncbi:hypothetical protein C8R43DRAFT_109302 [Mycena crocata]|nr:hypothetical protein C8R43DRAFT_109302 [Mycena crocata]
MVFPVAVGIHSEPRYRTSLLPPRSRPEYYCRCPAIASRHPTTSRCLCRGCQYQFLQSNWSKYCGFLGSVALQTLRFSINDFAELTKIDPLQQAWFTNLTHLGLFLMNSGGHTVVCKRLRALPYLTHLSFDGLGRSIPPACPQLLDICKALRARWYFWAVGSDGLLATSPIRVSSL